MSHPVEQGQPHTSLDSQKQNTSKIPGAHSTKPPLVYKEEKVFFSPISSSYSFKMFLFLSFYSDSHSSI